MTRRAYPATEIFGAIGEDTIVGAPNAWRALGFPPLGFALIDDTFTDTNGTALSAHAPDRACLLDIDIDIDATGGTFDLTFLQSWRTPRVVTAIPYNVTADDLRDNFTNVNVSYWPFTDGGPGATSPLTYYWVQTTYDRYGTFDVAPTITADGTNLTGGAGTATVTENRPAWQLTGAWQIQGNAAQIPAATADAVALIDAVASSYRITADITWGIGANDRDEHAGLAFRGTNLTSYLRLVPHGKSGTRTFRIEEADGTVLCIFASSPVAIVDGATNTLEVDVLDDTIVARIDGNQIGSYTLEGALADTYGGGTIVYPDYYPNTPAHARIDQDGRGFTNTLVGLYSNEQDATPTAAFDNFTVYRLPNEEEISGPFGTPFERIDYQTIEVDATGGTFTITLDGATTLPIAFDATAPTIETALEAALPSQNFVSSGDGPVNAGPIFVGLSSPDGARDIMTTDPALLTGGAGTATVTRTALGFAFDDWRIDWTQPDARRYLSFRPARPVLAAKLNDLRLRIRTARTGAGFIQAFVGVVNSQGTVRWAAASAAGTNVPTDGTLTFSLVDALGLNAAGIQWDRYDLTQLFVKLLSQTNDDATDFGTVTGFDCFLELDWSEEPVITVDAVDVTGANPEIAWTYTHPFSDDEQSRYEVRVWDPAVIAANPTTALEDLEAVYASGRISSPEARTHRVAITLDAGTLYTFGVRAWSPDVVNRDNISAWDTSDATTPAAIDSTAVVGTVVAADEVTVTVSAPGTGEFATIERTTDGTTWEVIEAGAEVTGATVEAVDTFNRANGALGNEEGPNTHAWAVEGGTTGAIVSNAAELTGVGHATVDVGNANVRVAATVNLTGPDSGVVARRSATLGYVLAKIGPSEVDLIIWDEVGGSEHSPVTAVAHGITDPTAVLELVVSGDEYVVNVNGTTLIREIVASAPSAAATEVGISGAGAAGVHTFDDFTADALDGTVVYVDRGVPVSNAVQYRARFYQTSATGQFFATALATSGVVAVTQSTWRLTSQTTSGLTLAFDPEDVSVEYERPNTDVRYVEGVVQVFGATLAPALFSMTIRTLNAADRTAIRALMAEPGLHTLTDIFGTSTTVKFFGNVIERLVVAEPDPSESTPIADHYTFAVQLQAVR